MIIPNELLSYFNVQFSFIPFGKLSTTKTTEQSLLTLLLKLKIKNFYIQNHILAQKMMEKNRKQNRAQRAMLKVSSVSKRSINSQNHY